jgi:hypothetical protein
MQKSVQKRKRRLLRMRDDHGCRRIAEFLRFKGPSSWSAIWSAASDLDVGSEHTLGNHLAHLIDDGVAARLPKNGGRGKRGVYRLTGRARDELFPPAGSNPEDIERFLRRHAARRAQVMSELLRYATTETSPHAALTWAEKWYKELEALVHDAIHVTLHGGTVLELESSEERTVPVKPRQRMLPHVLKAVLGPVLRSINDASI